VLALWAARASGRRRVWGRRCACRVPDPTGGSSDHHWSTGHPAL